MASPKIRKPTPMAKSNTAALLAKAVRATHADSPVGSLVPRRIQELDEVEKSARTPKKSMNPTVEDDYEEAVGTETAGLGQEFTYRDIPDGEIDLNPKAPKKPKKSKKGKKGKAEGPGTPATKMRSPTAKEKQARLVENLRLYSPAYAPTTSMEDKSREQLRENLVSAEAKKSLLAMSNLSERMPELSKELDREAGPASRGPSTEECAKREPGLGSFYNVLYPKSLDDILTKLKAYEAAYPKNTITSKLTNMFTAHLRPHPELIIGAMTSATSEPPKSTAEAEILLANLQVFLKLDPASVETRNLIDMIESHKFANPSSKPPTAFLRAGSGVPVDLEGKAAPGACAFWSEAENMTGAELNASFKMGMDRAAGAKISGMSIDSPASPGQSAWPSKSRAPPGHENRAKLEGDGITVAKRAAEETEGSETAVRRNATLAASNMGEQGEEDSPHNYSLLPASHKADQMVKVCVEENTEEALAMFEEYLGVVSNALTQYGPSSWLQCAILEKISAQLPVGHVLNYKPYGDTLSRCIANMINGVLPHFYHATILEDHASRILTVFICHCGALWRLVGIELKKRQADAITSGMGAMSFLVSSTFKSMFEKGDCWEHGLLILTTLTTWLMYEFIMTEEGDLSVIMKDAEQVVRRKEDLLDLFHERAAVEIPARKRIHARFTEEKKMAGSTQAAAAESTGTPLQLALEADDEADDDKPVESEVTTFKLVPGLGRPPPAVVHLVEGFTAKVSEFGATIPEVMKRLEAMLVQTITADLPGSDEEKMQALTDLFACVGALWHLIHAEVLTAADGTAHNGLRVMSQLVSFALDPDQLSKPAVRMKILRTSSVWIWGHYVRTKGDFGFIREQAKEYIQSDGQYVTRFFGLDLEPAKREKLAEAIEQATDKALGESYAKHNENEADVHLESMEYIEPSAIPAQEEEEQRSSPTSPPASPALAPSPTTFTVLPIDQPGSPRGTVSHTHPHPPTPPTNSGDMPPPVSPVSVNTTAIQSTLQNLETGVAAITQALHAASATADRNAQAQQHALAVVQAQHEEATQHTQASATLLNDKLAAVAAQLADMCRQLGRVVATSQQTQDALSALAASVGQLHTAATATNQALQTRIAELETRQASAHATLELREGEARTWCREMGVLQEADALSGLLWPQGYSACSHPAAAAAAGDEGEARAVQGARKELYVKIGDQAGRGQGGGGFCAVM